MDFSASKIISFQMDSNPLATSLSLSRFSCKVADNFHVVSLWTGVEKSAHQLYAMSQPFCQFLRAGWSSTSQLVRPVGYYPCNVLDCWARERKSKKSSLFLPCRGFIWFFSCTSSVKIDRYSIDRERRPRNRSGRTNKQMERKIEIEREWIIKHTVKQKGRAKAPY